jgi:methionyl-tRNA formyltransferase
MKKILICSHNNFFKKKIQKKNYFFISKKKKFNLNYIKKLNPDLIFFPHWNYIINKNIFNNFKCIGFHSSPLPYGRGGSPVQNMIVRNKTFTDVCAFQINQKLDSGPIYERKKVSLKGSGDKIFSRIYLIIFKMIQRLEKKLPKPKKQSGRVTFFKRRKPHQSNLLNIKNINEIYNLIRMMDVNQANYPKAFIENNKIIYKFKDVKLKNDKIEAKVDILRK